MSSALLLVVDDLLVMVGLDVSLPVAVEALPLVSLTCGLLVLPFALYQVHLIDFHRRSSPRRSFREAVVDDFVFGTGT